jgi:hypothetical protein
VTALIKYADFFGEKQAGCWMLEPTNGVQAPGSRIKHPASSIQSRVFLPIVLQLHAEPIRQAIDESIVCCNLADVQDGSFGKTGAS